VDDLLDVLDQPQLTVTQLDGNLGRGLEGLMVLPAPTDPARMARLDEASYSKVIRRLQDLVGILVLDCGTGLNEPAARAALATADQIVLVSDAEPATASLVSEAAELLRSAGPPLTLMVNKLPPKNARLDLEALGRLIPDASAMVTMQADHDAASRLSTGGFEWDGASPDWQTAIRELGVVLTAQWRALGLAT
jgi:MinD-like ATPase involved in chromosome partitioning or flagellar assembly